MSTLDSLQFDVDFSIYMFFSHVARNVGNVCTRASSRTMQIPSPSEGPLARSDMIKHRTLLFQPFPCPSPQIPRQDSAVCSADLQNPIPSLITNPENPMASSLFSTIQ